MNLIARIIPSVVIAFLCGGCNLLGYAASGIAGDPKTPAVFTMAKRPTVVVAEKFDNPAEAAMDAEPIARYISEDLAAHEVAPILDSGKVASLQAENPAKWRGMTIAAVGRSVGAEQILYVNIINVNVNFADNSDLIRGRGEIRVRLVDANTGATIWPVEAADGYPILAETRIVRRAERDDSIVRSDVHRALAARAARLFYVVKSD